MLTFLLVRTLLIIRSLRHRFVSNPGVNHGIRVFISVAKYNIWSHSPSLDKGCLIMCLIMHAARFIRSRLSLQRGSK